MKVCLHPHAHTQKENDDLKSVCFNYIYIYQEVLYDVTTVMSLMVYTLSFLFSRSSRLSLSRLSSQYYSANISLSVPAASADAFMHEPLVSNQHRPFPFL